MGWDDIDLDKVVAGMITFKDTSVVNVGDYLDTFARAIAEKDQITMPETVSGEGVPIELITFSGAPVGSAAFKANYRKMLSRLKAKIDFPWTRNRQNSFNPWYFNTVLTDVNNASLYEVSQDDFRNAMGEGAYDLLFSENSLNSVAFDRLWTAEILQSIKPALELMQVFVPLIDFSDSIGSPVGDIFLNQLDSINGEAATSIALDRDSFRTTNNATFADLLSQNTNPWFTVPLDISASARSYRGSTGISHASTSDISVPGSWANFDQLFRDKTRLRYKTQDLNDVTVAMEVTAVSEISFNIRFTNRDYRATYPDQPFLTNYPIISDGARLIVNTPVISNDFSDAEGVGQVLSFFDNSPLGPVPFEPQAPLGGEDLSKGGYSETQAFNADDKTFYVNTNNSALEFFIAP